MNNSIIDVGRGVDIVGQVMSKFSISLLIMTIGMIVGAMFVPPAVAIMMPIVCVVMLLVAMFARWRQRESEGSYISMKFVYDFAALEGVGLYPIVMAYTQAIGAKLVLGAVAITFVLFFGLATYAKRTERNFLNIGSILFGALLILILASIVGIFVQATILQTAICAGGLRSMIGLAAGTLDRIGTFVTFLLPVLSAALSASGGMTSAAALYAGSMLFIDVLMRLIRSLLIPLTYAFTALSAAECAVGGETLQRLRELTGWIIQTALKGVMYVFTAYLTVTGLIAGSADAAAVKAAGSAHSTAVPVVGSILSGAAGTVLAGADIVRNYAGVFGLLAILATGLAPFCRIGVHYLALKLTAAVGGTMQCGGLGGLLSNLSAAMGYMLALTGCAALMALLSTCWFMKAVRL